MGETAHYGSTSPNLEDVTTQENLPLPGTYNSIPCSNHSTLETFTPLILVTYGPQVLSDVGYTSMGIYLLLVGVAATLGNSIVVVIILRDPKLRKKSHNLLLLNLAVSDLGISIFGYPPTTASSFAGHWLFGHVGCQIQGAMCTILALTDINTLLALSVYRYIAVCKPHLEYVVNSRRVTVIVVLSTWLYSVAWAVAALLGWNRFELEPYGTLCSIAWASQDPGDVAYTVLMILTCYISHIIVMTYCYAHVKIVSDACTKRFFQQRTFSIEDVVHDTRNRSERKLTWMSLLMVGSFTVIWSPYAWTAIWAVVDPAIPLWLTTFPSMFAKSSCMVNPLIYSLTNPSFRQSVQKLWFKCKPPNHVNDVTKAAVHARKRKLRSYVIDSTKEGIYIGRRHVEIEVSESVF